ncbi:transposase [Parageobacillus galactosidasius]|nr:transposase [Parageobacillus galactosidasius]
MLHRWGFRYTRPTYTLKRANPQKQKEFQQEMELIKKNLSDNMVIIYEDESHIRDYQTLRATWSVKGRQKQIPTYGHHATVSLLGGVNIKTGEFHCMETNQCNAHRPSRDQFCCRACGYAAPADNVAAENIRRAAVNQPNAAAN